MTWSDLIRFLQRIKLGVVSSLAPDGAPQSAGCKLAIREARAHHHPHPDQN